jgi:hypothetical protein
MVLNIFWHRWCELANSIEVGCLVAKFLFNIIYHLGFQFWYYKILATLEITEIHEIRRIF